MTGRPGARRPELPSSQLTTAEYFTLVALLAGAVIATAVFVAWAYQQRGLLSPGTVPNLRTSWRRTDEQEPARGPDAPA